MAEGLEKGLEGATKLRIHNSFIWPYLHIFSAAALRRRKKRAEIGIWLAFVANIPPLPPSPFLSVPYSGYGYSRGPGRGRGRALPRHSSNSSHVIVENETNFCNLIAFRVDAEQRRKREENGGGAQGRACASQ